MTDPRYVAVISCLACIIIGYVIGYLLSNIDHHGKPDSPIGYFIINYDDPTKELFRVNFKKDLDWIEAHRYISLEVIVEKDEKLNTENSQGENS